MPNYLSENDWKTELKKKEHKDVKKTGISEALRDYEKAAKKGGREAIAALDELIKVAGGAKSKHAKLKSLCDYLDRIAGAAGTAKTQLAQNLPSDDPVRDGQLKRLQIVRTITDPERAFNVVCTPGRRTGIYLSKNPISAQHVQIVREFRGKGRGGPILRGLAYGDSGKLVFDFGEVEPPKGVAKALRKTLKTHFDLQSLKVIAKGASQTLDDETDVDDVDFENSFEQATGLTDHKAGDRVAPVQTANYTPAEEWDRLLKGLQARDAEGRAGMRDGLLGIARRDGEMLKNDQALSVEMKRTRAKIISDAVAEVKRIMGTAAPQAPQHPSVAPQTQTRVDRRREIAEVLTKNLQFVAKAAFAKGGAAAIGTKPGLMAGGAHLGPVQAALAACEGGHDAGRLKAVRDACDAYEAGRASAERGFVPGTAAAALARKELDPGSNFKACAKIYQACETNPSAKNLELLRKACEAYLKGNAKDLEKAKPQDVAKIEAKRDIVRGWQLAVLEVQDPKAFVAQHAVVLQARTQVRLAEIAAEFEQLGDPSGWTREQEEIAAELEAAYLFEEGTVSQGARFGAVPLGGEEGGVNPAFWIKRKRPGATNDEAESLYIFKPGDAEADVVAGLPAGSGAAREVFAKDLAEALGASGFSVDVCPTDLVRIDGAKLPGSKDAKPRTGAMQRLGGDVKGNIRGHLEKDPGLAARIDKAAYDQLAVFDLIIGNLDRHAGNILLAGDPGGTPKLVPIDHGTSMPGRDALKLNTSRMEHPLNVLMSPELTQGDQPLDPATVKLLRGLDPAAIAKTMRDSQARLQQRHDGLKAPAMGLDDEQIKIMERTTRFMQAAAEKLTVRELFEAKARHLDEILKDPEPDWARLVDAIADELRAWHAAKQEANKFVNLETTSWMSNLNALQALGWCMGMSQAQGRQWATDHADLVVRILAGRLENPALQDEADALRKELGKPADQVAKTLPLVQQVRQLRDRLNGANLPDSLRSAQPIRDGIQRLGGERTLAKVLAFCAHARDNLENREGAIAKAGSPEDKEAAEIDLLAAKYELLRIWQRFEAAGGIAEYVRLGGKQAEEPLDAYNLLVSLKAQERASGEVRGMKPEEVSKRQVANLESLEKAFLAEHQKARGSTLVAGTKADFEKLQKLEATDPNAAQAGLEKLVARLASKVITEATAVKVHRDETKRIGEMLAKVPQGVDVSAVRKEFDALDQATDGDIIESDGAFGGRRAKLLAQAEVLALGAESPQSKFDQRLQDVGKAIAAFGTAPFHGVMQQVRAALAQRLQDFLHDQLDNDLRALERGLEYAAQHAAVRKTLDTQLVGHASEASARKALDEVDDWFAKMTVQNFNTSVARLSVALSDAAVIVRRATSG
ncbi:MAG: hypothetical protein HY749_12740 [Gammaproteobacteria bacterium]|nr:hypothetical protein [Gammaproteobacteria bacterium]